MLNEKQLKNYIKKVIKEEIDSYNHPEQSNDNAFASDHRTNAAKFSHDGVDTYFARKDQDNMHKSEKDRIRRADKRWQKAADSRPLHRKGSLNRELGESKIQEGNCRYVFHCIMKPEKGNETMCIDNINDIKPYIKDALYWDVCKGNNSTDPNNLVAWGGGPGGFWYNFLNKPDWAKEGVHWNKPSERDRQLVLSKRKDFGNVYENSQIKESESDYDDDSEYFKQEEEDELNYDLKELSKAFQKSNGTYHAKSSDGSFQTGDKVIVHGKTKEIEGIIEDFDTNFMTYEETCDVKYQKDGKEWTMIGVPLSKVEKIS